MKVYRIENKNGIGPYWLSEETAADLRLMRKNHNSNLDLYPNGQHEKLRNQEQDEFCGFINEAQLHNWFSELELRMLKTIGYNVVMLSNVEITLMTPNQVFFRRR